jgi:hypothetical protein
MFRHSPAVGAYRCPADRSPVTGDKAQRRTRSYTMNGWINSVQHDSGVSFDGTMNDHEFKSVLHKSFDVRRLSPAGTFVFIDEKEASIDDGIWN